MIKIHFIQKFALVLWGSLLCTQAYAQHTTDFLFVETVSENLRKTMQNNAKAVFAEINRAYDQNKPELTLSPSNVTDEASKRIHTMWATSHFYSTKAGIITTRVLKSSNGYQVRNIPIFIKEGETKEDNFQDCVIEFTINGKISDIYIAIEPHQYSKMMSSSNEVNDLRYRQMILELVENFRTAYNRKDTSFLNRIYSNDALIISGKELKQDKKKESPNPEFHTKAQIIYTVQDKKTYLSKLQGVFNANSYINIKFDEIVVTRHEGNPNIYGVTLKQDWNASGGYHDIGWLFLTIDYKDEEKPLIWVRTWQPLEDANGNPIHYSTEDIFGLGNFRFK